MFLLKFKNSDIFYLSLKVAEVIGTHTRSSVNHPNNVEIMNLSQGTGSNSIFLKIKNKKDYCNEVQIWYSPI